MSQTYIPTKKPYQPKDEEKNASYSAVIIEPRGHKNLPLVVHQVHSKLHCKIHIFHGTENIDMVEKLQSELLNIELHNLNEPNYTIAMYNELVYDNKRFWNNFDTDYVLIFQIDSCLMEDSDFSIEDFLGYDYVGAPWSWLQDEKDPCYLGGNGGFSLRKVSTHKQINETHRVKNCEYEWEDQHFSKFSKNLPDRSISSQFSIESLYDKNVNPKPFGCHKFWNYMSLDQAMQIYNDHPETLILAKNHGR